MAITTGFPAEINLIGTLGATEQCDFLQIVHLQDNLAADIQLNEYDSLAGEVRRQGRTETLVATLTVDFPTSDEATAASTSTTSDGTDGKLAVRLDKGDLPTGSRGQHRYTIVGLVGSDRADPLVNGLIDVHRGAYDAPSS